MLSVTMPRLGVTMQTGTVAAWHTESGETVRTGEPLLDVESEKSVITIEAQGDGTLHILVPAAEEVPVGRVIAVIAEAGEAIDEALLTADAGIVQEDRTVPTAPSKEVRGGEDGHEYRVLPRVRRLARDLGVDLSEVVPTGSGGSITEADVRTAPSGAKVPERREPLVGVRKAMAEAVSRSWASIPQFTQMLRVRADALVAYRAASASVITYTDIFVKAVGALLRDVPNYNAYCDGDAKVFLRRIGVSVAIKTDAGLLVPTIPDADSLSLAEIHHALVNLTERSRTHGLEPTDYSPAAVTVSNLGMFGIDTGVPLLNPDQSVLVFVGALADEVVVSGGEVTVAKILQVSITYDHRIVDGVDGAQFSNALRQRLENPSQIE